ncbi:MAG: diguanylate cyclase [Lachnospiraceae bacterium]|jgi:diguanylate cyclase (GGDEF)-like protein|nr:diguanylate cyclase [Lachnospiraceae bacterium]
MNKRIKVGLLVDDIDAGFTQQTCIGAELGAKSIDANLYIFPMKYLDHREFLEEHSRFEYQYNMIHRFITKKNIDILFVMIGNIGCRTDFEKQIEFLNSLPKIPIVTLFTAYDGYPSVIFDNKVGFEKTINHLIKEHNAQKIGYVGGPMTNGDAIERLGVFKECLEKNGLTYDTNRVVYGNFEAACEDVVEELLDKNQDLDAVVFANDLMALGGYNVFKRRKLSIGKDILVTGFDNASFTSNIIPSLTTVDANAAKLAFQAISKSKEFIAKTQESFKIDTFFINRESCGCDSIDITSYEDEMDLTPVFEKEKLPVDAIFEYLFGEYSLGNALDEIEADFKEFLYVLFDAAKYSRFSQDKKLIKEKFAAITGHPILLYTTTEKVFNMLSVFKRQMRQFSTEPEYLVELAEVFAMLYRQFTMHNSQMIEKQHQHIIEISEMVNHMTSDIFVYDSNTENAYYSMFSRFGKLGLKSAYMLSFGDIVRHYRGDDWVQPQKLRLKAYEVDGVVGVLSMADASVKVNDMFDMEYMPDHRATMVLSPLYSFEEVYGVMLCEVDSKSFDCVTPVSVQLSSALKSLILIEKQKDIQRELENNLKRIEESNFVLDEISKSDELTGVLNRRGFVDKAHEIITKKSSRGKHAIITYSDMDNLKMINDKFGHDDGDFAIRECAQILRDTFRNSDVVSRFGGDEFVCLAIMGVDGKGSDIKDRIEVITANHNAMIDKPYPVEMSTGYCEFTCGEDVDLYKLLDIADTMLYEEKNEKKKKNGSYR